MKVIIAAITIGIIAGLSVLIPQVWGADLKRAEDLSYGSFSITEKQVRYNIPYHISNGIINDMTLYCEYGSLLIQITAQNESDVKLTLDLPRSVLNPKINDKDDQFFVLRDGQEIEYGEIPYTKHREISMSFPADTKEIEIIHAFIPELKPEMCEIVHDLPYSYVLPPLKQINSGITFSEIQCKDNLALVQKYDGSPACVKPESITKLIERKWINPIKYNNKHCEDSTWNCSQQIPDLTDNISKHDDANLESGTFYAQPQLTSVIIKKDSTVRVHLFSYAITEYSDGEWTQVFDERPKNSRIGIVEKSTDNAKAFTSTGYEILPNGITAKILLEEGYYVVYLTADSYSKAGKYELSIVSIDENGAVIEKPLHVRIVEQPSAISSQEKFLRVVGFGPKFGIDFDNISEQEYWKREDSRKPWPPVPILNITDNNIHPAVKKLIDAMWDPSGKYSPFEYDKNILVKDMQVIFSGSDHMAITDWLKKIHDQQFERNLDDSSSDYIRYQDKIYTFGGWIAD